ncbi:MAG: hypothetical protein ACRDK5_00680 [Solirubrobacterales bacterium]
MLHENAAFIALPGLLFDFGVSEPLQRVNPAEAVPAELNEMTPKTATTETRTTIRRLSHQPRPDRIELIT